MIYLDENEELIEMIRNSNNEKAVRLLEEFIKRHDCSVAQKNEYAIPDVSVSLPVEKANEARYAYAADYSPELRHEIEEAHLAGQRFVMKQLGLELIYDNER